MAGAECPPVTVEADWGPVPTKNVKNKLQVYFQSKKKSGGGECRVEAEEGAPSAAVYFRSEDVRKRVVARDDHEIILENKTVKLRLGSAATPASSEHVAAAGGERPGGERPGGVRPGGVRPGGVRPGGEQPVTRSRNYEILPPNLSPSDPSEAAAVTSAAGGGASAESEDELSAASLGLQQPLAQASSARNPAQSGAVVLDNVTTQMSGDLLSMLVENVSGLDESGYSLEIIYESSIAVVTFNRPADMEKFLTVSQSSQKLQKWGLTARPLEAAKSVRLESLPPTVVKDPAQSGAVVLDNVTTQMSGDLLSMLVENVSGLDESGYSLEIIYESSIAVVTFNRPADMEKFLTVSQSSQKLQKWGLTARPLKAAKSVRVESLPPTVVKDMLELYFEKHWALPDHVVMIPDEQAAIVTFSDPKAVKSICVKEDYEMRSIPIKVYPYYESLGTALYGKARRPWRLPEAFTERVHPAVQRFLLKSKLTGSIDAAMRPYFCSVNLEAAEAKLSPTSSLLRQRDLTADKLDGWRRTAQEAFCQHMSQFTAFECVVSSAVWKAVENEVCSVVRDDAVAVVEASRGVVIVAGRADRIKQIRAPVEKIVLKATDQIQRQTEGVSEDVDLSPAMFYILNQSGLQKATQDISSDMKLAYNDRHQKLTITGLPAEVYQTKAWILEKNVGMSKKHIDVSAGLLDFLKMVDPMDMSQHLFTSQGTCAIYSIESKGLLLLGSSDGSLSDAENKIKTALSLQMLDVEDQEVLKLPRWASLNQQLLDSYNSSKRRTVAIQTHLGRRDQVTVVGFLNPVKEVGRALREFIANYSRVQETIRVESCAVVQFIDKLKSQECSRIEKDNDVKIFFDEERPKIHIAGARVHVQTAKSVLTELTDALCTDVFRVDKPGAKKYFQSQGSMSLSSIMSELRCAVVLRPEAPEEDEDDSGEEESGVCYCKVQTASGVLVSVRKADICVLGVDAVVNAANEELHHIGGLALALLRAAGPKLQEISNNYTAQHGKLKPGDAVVTDGCNLPCRFVVHAVGPRFSDYDRKSAVACLKKAVQESLRQADRVSCCSVALPAISAGVFGFPVGLCADTIAEAVLEFCDGPVSPSSLTQVHMVDNNEATVRTLAAAVNRVFADLGPTLTPPQAEGGTSAGASGGHQRGRGGGQSSSSRGRGGAERGGGRGGAAWASGGGSQGGGHGPRGHGRPGGSARVEQTTAEGLKIVLQRGNIEDQTTGVIVNTISETMNLSQGAVSKAILQAAGSGLQAAVQSASGVPNLQYGDVVVTDGFRLKCQKIFHAVCPFWDNGCGQAEQELVSIIRYCLAEAEKRRLTSLSFPAIGTGNLSFPRDLVSRVLLKEIHWYSRMRSPHHLKEVAVVVHPSDAQTIECFTREFKGQTAQRNEHEAQEVNEPAFTPSAGQSQQSTASFSQVASPSLGVYQMQMGQLTLEVSSGDITRETCDVIINSSNQNFTLRSGVSKAILDAAGLEVEQECSRLVNSPGYQPRPMILTSAGQLPCRHIIHVVGQKDPAIIKDMVFSILKICEENKFGSVAFPALGTGVGGADPSAVADAMVGAVVDFVRKKQQRFVHSVKILIFQMVMMMEFHKCMKKREGEEVKVKVKSFLTKVKDAVSDTFSSLFMGVSGERPNTDDLVLETEEFEPTVFQLCANNNKAVTMAKKRIQDMIVYEQLEKTISDKYISQVTQADVDELRNLQRKLTVSIRLDKGEDDQEPRIHLAGLTRDVLTAESAVRDIIRKVERMENLRSRAFLLSGRVEWQYPLPDGTMVPFDNHTNLSLEEALEKKQTVKIKINDKPYFAHVLQRKAVSQNGQEEVELLRKDPKADDAALPSEWDDMKGDDVKRFPLTVGSNEYNDVEKEFKRTTLTNTIVSIERVQNVTLWKSYQLMKKQLEKKNQHKNNEQRLFHGTAATFIDLIDKQGFKQSYAGQHGALYGNGSYFAVDPAYSARGDAQPDAQPEAQPDAKPDANGQKRMYLARVLVGDFTQGQKGMITPPAKGSGNAADLYDSVTDSTSNPTMFIVFNDIQAYPEYLITFT